MQEDIDASIARRGARFAARPRVSYPEALPISARRDEIAQTIRDHQVVIICGETGSGKSTQLPKICLELGRGVVGMIGHTQPRRIAARSIAARIAEELRTPLGGAVGYKIRFGDKTSDDTFIKVLTDGMLLAETQADRFLNQYDTIIIDEAHERSLNIDFLLGILKQLLTKRRELKLIITSATIDPHRFSDHFDQAPIIEVSGRMYPVKQRYRPLRTEDEDEADRNLQQAVRAAVEEATGVDPFGDILIFMAGEREIRETAQSLRRLNLNQTEVLPLYARLSHAEQNRVFERHQGRRIVIATNVAETSVTVPGVRFVIDPGVARISRYSARSSVQRLPIEAISQASANQRAGRCGRVSDGVCIRLFSEDDFRGRDAFTQAEIQRTNLAGVILQMKAMHLGAIESFPFIDPPKRAMVREGERTLRELGAIDAKNQLTPIGRELARLPIDPRLGRMIVAGREEDCLAEVLVIAAALAAQDPRERPIDKQEQADAAHERFADESSDFLGLLKLWSFYHEQKEKLSRSRLRKACQQNFLSYLRLREWCDVHQQLRLLARDAGMRINLAPANVDDIHRALLAGLLSHVARKGEKYEYEAAHGRTCFIHPGSGQFSERPQWLVAAELVETTKLYARTVARIQPEWIERIAAHLVKRSYFEPQWEEKGARVIAFEKVSLYGLEIVARRQVHYGPIDPVRSRELFIHHALVEGEFETAAPFFEHNLALIEEIEALEAKQRKRDVLIDASVRYAFYDERLPADIHSGGRFEKWRREVEARNPRLLFMEREDLMRHDAASVTGGDFPDTMLVAGTACPLTYRLEPGQDDDGVTLMLPVELVNQLHDDLATWLVPGLMEEKVTALIRGLPKSLRRNFVPVPDYARACAERLAHDRRGDSFLASLGALLHEFTGVEVQHDAWDVGGLHDHLRLNVRVIDAAGEVLGEGRDLGALRELIAGGAAERFAAAAAESEFNREGITTWDFGDLPDAIEVTRGGMALRAFPALVDAGDSVSIRLHDTIDSAAAHHRGGVRRLFIGRARNELREQMEHLPHIETMTLHYAPLGEGVAFRDQLEACIVDRAFIGKRSPPRTRAGFDEMYNRGWNGLWQTGLEVCDLASVILAKHHEVSLLLSGSVPDAWRSAVDDMDGQLARLVPPDFLVTTAWESLLEYPRYLAGIAIRFERLRHGGHLKDARKGTEVEAFQTRYDDRAAWHRARGVIDPGLEAFRWLLEELRISAFAPEQGTARPISGKRLEQAWADVGD